MKKFGEGVSSQQIALARRFEAAGLTSYSQAIKAFTKRDDTKIEEWKKELREKSGETN